MVRVQLRGVFGAALVCTCFVFVNGFGQTTIPLHFESLTINEGLSQGFVSSITQDKKGFMWFATSDGLNKYDGYAFTVYHHNPQDATSIADDEIAYVYEDTHERLWICFRKGGLDLFDREHLQFYHIRRNAPGGVPANNNYSITEGKDGALWIRTPQGIDRMVISEIPPAAGQKQTFSNTHTVRITRLHLPPAETVENDDVVPRIFVDSRGRVFACYPRAIYPVQFNAKRETYFLKTPLRIEAGRGMRAVNLMEDTVRRALYLHTEKNISRLSDTGRTLVYTHAQISDFWDFWGLDRNGALWFNESNGLTRLHPHTGAWERIAADNSELENLIKYTYCFYTDRTGVLWIGTSGYGVLKYDPGKERFHALLPGEYVYKIFANGEGNIVLKDWFQLSLRAGAAGPTPIIDKTILERYNAFSSDINVCQDSRGTYWFALKWKLLQYDAVAKSTVSITFPPATGNTSRIMPFADRQGNLWMSASKYLLRFNTATHQFFKYPYPVPSEANDFLQAIQMDADSIFWLGTQSGLLRFDKENGSWKHWFHNERDSTTLSNDFVLSFCNDPAEPTRYLWVGTKGGLNKMDKATGRFRSVTTRNGLPNNVIYGILADRHGRLWLSTNQGLAEFNPATGALRTFDVNDGLQANEFNRFAFCKTRDGLLVFGGVNGLNYFDPDDIQPLQPPHVVLTDFRLFNQSVNFKTPYAPLQQDIAFANALTLNHKQNMFTLQFAAMDYRKAGSVRYRYRMQGFDRDWIYGGAAREATYTNLDPGTYTFVVEGSNSDGVWGQAQQGLQITVLAPWWRTGWAYALAVFSIGLVLYLLYRYRVTQLLKLERMRNRIARDLHDEIGSSLSTISIYSKVAQAQLPEASANAQPLLQKISDNATEVQEAMSDIVWSIDPRNETFENLVNRMREHAVQLFEAKGYALHFHFDPELTPYRFSMERRNDFYLIYKEGLNNIAKYAEGKNVSINLSGTGKDIMLIIKDDGKGFDAAEGRQSGNGLRNMQSRAAGLRGTFRITSAKGAGTSLWLKFPK